MEYMDMMQQSHRKRSKWKLSDGYSALCAIASLPLNFVHHQPREKAKLIFR